MSVVRTLRVREDRVQFPAPRFKSSAGEAGRGKSLSPKIAADWKNLDSVGVF